MVKYLWRVAVPMLIVCSSASSAVVELALLNRCAESNDGQYRLNCYDRVVEAARGTTVPKATPIAKPTTPSGQPSQVSAAPSRGQGNWVRTTITSPFDDSPSLVLKLKSNKAVATKLGTGRPTLIATCKNGETDLAVEWGVFITASSTTVNTRFDDQPTANLPASPSNTHTATFIGYAINLLNEMPKRKQLLVQVVPYGEDAIHTSFTLDGIATLLPELRARCGW